MHPMSFSAGTSPTGSRQHESAVSDDEQPDITMTDVSIENVNGTYKSTKREAQGYKRSKVGDTLKLLKKSEGRMASEPKHSTTSHPEKNYASDILKIQQMHAFDYGSDQEISTA